MPFKVVSQKGFIKGVVASMDRFSTPKGAVERASNLLMTGRGALHACDGTALQSKLLGASGVIYEIGQFVSPTFAATNLAMIPNTPSNIGVYSWLGTGDTLSLIGSVNITANWQLPQIVEFAGVAILSLGNGAPIQQFDGVNFTPLFCAGAPGTTSGTAPWQRNHFYSVGDRIVAQAAQPGGGTTASTFQVVQVTINQANGEMSNSSPVGGGGLSGDSTPNFAGAGGVLGSGRTVTDNQLIWMLIKQTPDLGAESVPPGAAHIINHAAALWCWNTSPQNVATPGGGAPSVINGPSVLRQSAINNPNSWPLAYATYVGQSDGQQGTGIGTFTIAEAGISPTGSLVLFKEYSTYTVVSTFGSPNFQITEVKTDMGCLAGRTVQFATGFGLIRFCHLGFALFDGVNDRLISEEVRPYIFGNQATGLDRIVGIDFANATLGRAMLTANPPLYVCMMPTLDGLRTRIFCYDLVMRAWMIVDYMNSSAQWPITTMKQLRPPSQALTLLGQGVHSYICDSNGGNVFIRQWEQGDPAWDATSPATPVAWSVRPPDVGEPASRAYYRRVNVRLTATAPGAINGIFQIGKVQQPANAETDQGVGPSSGIPPNTSAVVTGLYNGKQDLGVALDVGQTGPSLSSQISGTGPTVLEGFDWHVTPKAPRPFGGLL